MTLRMLGLVGLVSVALTACGQATEEPDSAPAFVPAPAAAPITVPWLTGEGLASAAFGSPVADVVAMLTPVMGGAPVASANPDCPSGATQDFAWGERLGLVSRDGAFIGWRSREAGPATASGLRVGDPRAKAEAGADFAVIEAPFDRVLFTTDGVFGFLDETGEAVETLYAGEICIAS